MSELMEEVEIDASIEANARSIELVVTPVERGVDVEVDRQILAAAITNLLQNAFKFSRAHGHVSLKTTATADRVLFEIEDECGGLPGCVQQQGDSHPQHELKGREAYAHLQCKDKCSLKRWIED